MFYVTLLEPEIILKSHHHLLSFVSKIDPFFFSKLQRVKITWFLTVCSFWKSPQKSQWSHHTASVVKTASKCEFCNFCEIQNFWYEINVRYFRWFSNTVVFFSTLHVSRHVKIEFISSFVFTSKLSMARNTWLTPEKERLDFSKIHSCFFALFILWSWLCMH